MTKRLIVALPLLLCAAAAAATNSVARFADAYQRIATDIASRWHTAASASCYATAVAFSNTCLHSAHLRAAASAVSAYETLRTRLDTPDDDLAGLDICQPALALDGVPRVLYDRAEACFWRQDYARALQLFALLVSSNNIDGVTIGNSHYWLGVLLHEIQHQPIAALPHYLEVHRQPACLVFTDDAYIRAAAMYAWRGHYDTALALYAIRIPSIDYYENEWRKALASTDLARRFGDVTNQVRQALRLRDAAAHAPRFAPAAAQLWQDIDAGLAPSGRLAIAEYLSGAESFDLYAMQAIQRALTGPDAATNDPALTDMLLHTWPSFDWVEQMHPVIVTNRELSNNIFQQKRHTELLPSNP